MFIETKDENDNDILINLNHVQRIFEKDNSNGIIKKKQTVIAFETKYYTEWIINESYQSFTDRVKKMLGD